MTTNLVEIPTLVPGKVLRVLMSLKVGGSSFEDLHSIVKRKQWRGGSWCPQSLDNSGILGSLLKIKEEMDVVVMSPRDLGYSDEWVQAVKVIDADNLAAWSSANLEGFVIEYLPPEAGPQILDQYESQSEGESLLICTRLLKVRNVARPFWSSERLFTLSRIRGDISRLSDRPINPISKIELETRIAFRLRKIDR